MTRFFRWWLLGLLVGAWPVWARAQSTLVLDDFEDGVGKWTRNDKAKTDNPAGGVLLTDVVATATDAGVVPDSSGAGLFSFKSAKGSWASASIRVDGFRWAEIGAQRLTFWLNADGAETGTELVLRTLTKNSAGKAVEESFTVPIRLSTKRWRRVVVPLSNFKNQNGPLLPRLHRVYLLQFVQRGSWGSRFFTVDQLQVEGSGVPLQTETDGRDGSLGGSSAGSTNIGGASSTRNDADVTKISIDFLKKQGRIRTGANVSVGAALPGARGAAAYPLQGNPRFRKALATLAPRLIRLDAAGLVELTDSSRPSFNFSRLVGAVRQVRALGVEPLLSLSIDPAWGLDAAGYGIYAASAARAVNQPGAKPVRLYELATASMPGGAMAPAGLDDATAIAFYNRGRTALKALSRFNRVGGIGLSSGNARSMAALLRGAQGIDFVSVSYFGANSGQPADNVLLANSRNLINLRAVAKLLDASRFRTAPLYVTQVNLNAGRDADFVPEDARTSQILAGVWWMSFMGNSSRLADQVFHNDAVNPKWGLLDSSARAYPTYYVMWMWNRFLPSGSERVLATATRGATPSNDVAVFAANAPGAHNVLVANLRDQTTTVKISIRGFPVLRAATMHLLEQPSEGIRQMVPLPKSPFQTIVLRPYAVAVVQFTEPPRKR
jgi:hypothetical protein